MKNSCNANIASQKIKFRKKQEFCVYIDFYYPFGRNIITKEERLISVKSYHLPGSFRKGRNAYFTVVSAINIYSNNNNNNNETTPNKIEKNTKKYYDNPTGSIPGLLFITVARCLRVRSAYINQYRCPSPVQEVVIFRVLSRALGVLPKLRILKISSAHRNIVSMGLKKNFEHQGEFALRPYFVRTITYVIIGFLEIPFQSQPQAALIGTFRNSTLDDKDNEMVSNRYC